MTEGFETGRGAARKLIATGLAVLGLALGASPAMAGCGMPAGNVHSPRNWLDARPGMARHDSIVGLWNVTFTSDGTAYPNPIPAGVQVDFGTVQWHADATEIMFSGGRPPSTGDVCMGVWKRTSPRTYELNHLALAWVSIDTPPPAGPVDPAQFLGPAVFHETVTVDADNNTYAGTFTIDQYAADGVSLVEHIGGTVNGTRMTVD